LQSLLLIGAANAFVVVVNITGDAIRIRIRATVIAVAAALPRPPPRFPAIMFDKFVCA
jgi:hypothetical protein